MILILSSVNVSKENNIIYGSIAYVTLTDGDIIIIG